MMFKLLMFLLIAEMLADIPEPEKFISEILASLPKWNPTSKVQKQECIDRLRQ